jgi:ABC-type Fe3+ transport system permease subunit
MDELRRLLESLDAREAAALLWTACRVHPVLATATVGTVLLWLWIGLDRRRREPQALEQSWASLWAMGAAGSLTLVVAVALVRF